MNTDEYEGHTPGPWTCLEPHQGVGDEVVVGVVAKGRKMPDGIALIGTVGTQPETLANARLIAAAPDLLADNKRLREGIMFFLDIDKQPSRAELMELIE
jgi:hypothetical protein